MIILLIPFLLFGCPQSSSYEECDQLLSDCKSETDTADDCYEFYCTDNVTYRTSSCGVYPCQ